MVSCSEKSPEYRKLLRANHADALEHLFETAEDQVAEAGPCLLCQERGSGLCRPSATSTGVELLVAGSPCDPFSTQRAHRFRPNAVSTHADYAVTMKTVINLYLQWQPCIGILEQVMGFLKPMSPQDPTTPYDKLPGAHLCSLHFMFV